MEAVDQALLQAGGTGQGKTGKHSAIQSQGGGGYSGQNGNCVEVARNLPGLVAIRDSKHPGGSALLVTTRAWRALTEDVRARSFR